MALKVEAGAILLLLILVNCTAARLLFEQVYPEDIPAEFDRPVRNRFCFITGSLRKSAFRDHADQTQARLDRFNSFPVRADFTESGSGFIVGNDEVWTALHVYEASQHGDPDSYTWVYCENDRQTKRKARFDRKVGRQIGEDLVVLKLDEPFKKTHLTLGQQTLVAMCDDLVRILKKGVRLFAIGYPYSVEHLRASIGEVVETYRTHDDFFQTDIPAVVGLSGSPVFAEDTINHGLILVGVVSSGEPDEWKYFDEGQVVAGTDVYPTAEC